MVNRLVKPSKNNSFFLFGARGCGKSTWLKEEFFARKEAVYFDLLDPEKVHLYQSNPGNFRAELEKILKNKQTQWIVIDEVQKCPELLDYVQMYIESHGVNFALSGSSARRLKQKGTNLLAGRAFVENLFPLTHIELGETFDLTQSLSFGTLPKLLEFSQIEDKKKFLRAYALLYIEKEIQQEQWVRNLVPFRRFLAVAAQMSGKILNLSKIAEDVGVDWSTVKNYYTILEDTLMGFHLPAFHQSVRKQQRQSPKFYFFDTGVCRALSNTLDEIPSSGTSYYGYLFEHFVLLEIIRLNTYYHTNFECSYLSPKGSGEVDLILSKGQKVHALIEIKSSKTVKESDAKNLNNWSKTFSQAKCLLLSQDTHEKSFGKTQALSWNEGLRQLFV